MDEIRPFKFHVEEHIGLDADAYFLTITLKPKLYKYSSITQLELTNNTVYQILYRCSKSFICVAEHTQAGNIHYHAVVAFGDKLRKIMMINMFKRNKDIGFVKIEDLPIVNKTKVSEYITKDLYVNHKIFRSCAGHNPRYHMCSCDYTTTYCC